MEAWADELMQIHVEKQNNFKRGELTKIFKELAEKYDDDITRIRNYYYRVVRKGNITTVVDESKIKQKEKEFKTFMQYPTFKVWIHSYKDEEGLEWISLTDIYEFLSEGKFRDFLETQNISDITYEFENENEEKAILISKEKLLKKISEFSTLTTSSKTQKELMEIDTLLKSDLDSLYHKKLEKIFFEIKPKDVLEVVVVRVFNYGAMAQLVDYPEINGLIHISEIKNGFVEDIHSYLREGDKLKARVKDKKDNFKLSFSLIGLDNNFSEKEKKFVNNLNTIDSHLDEDQKKALEELANSIKSKSSPSDNIYEFQYKNDLFSSETEEIERYIKSIVGPLSPAAKQKMSDLLRNYGLFKFSIKISETSNEFRNDLGYLFLEKVEEKLRDGL